MFFALDGEANGPQEARAPVTAMIPYSLSEARAVLKKQGREMDEYHRNLFGWLIERVAKLKSKSRKKRKRR